MDGIANNQIAKASPFRSFATGGAAEIFREQEMESQLEKLWMDGPALLNEEEPSRKRHSI